jgi:hypothetical protein
VDFTSGRLARLSGIGAAVLIATGGLLTNADYLPDAAEAKELYDDNTWALRIGAYAMSLAAVLLVVHGAVLFASLSNAAGRVSPLVGMGGAGLTAALLLVQASLVLGGAGRGTVDGGIPEVEALALYDIAVFGIAIPVALSVHLLGTAFAWRSTRDLPAWFVWTTLIVGIVLLVPEGFFLLPLALLWLVIVSLVLFRRGVAASS